jgi:5'-3' exonuclease
VTARRAPSQATWDRIDAARREQASRAPGVPRDTGSCEGPHCSAKIRWAKTVDGGRMPVDFTPDPDGRLIRVMVTKGDWRIRVLAAGEVPPAGENRWTSHYATCPDSEWFRARGQGRAAAVPERHPARRHLQPAPPPAAPAVEVLLAVDGNSLAHRAWHAYERSGMTAPDGRPIFAVYGFLALLAGIVDKTRPDALVVGFDDRTSSARRDRYPAYKAGRAAKDPDLYAQLDDIAAVLNALAVTVIVPAGLEADDVLGSAAAAAEQAGWRCVIATSDKDAFALITDTTTVLRLVSGLDNAQEITPAGLAGLYGGVTPDQWLDYVALVGDTSDNLPGVAGIGPKTAPKLLNQLGTVDAALADPAATAAAIGRAAAAKVAADDARTVLARNRDIMALVRELPVDPHTCRPTVTAATVAAVLRGRHLPSLVDRVTAALCPPAPPAGRRHLAVVPDPPAQLAAAAVRQAPPPARQNPAPTCPDCEAPYAQAMPLAAPTGGAYVLTGDQALIDLEHPAGDLLAVEVAGVWAVRRVAAGEARLPAGNRRRAHRCADYPGKCAVCGKPARIYLCGWRCNRHSPAARAARSATPPGE